MWKTWSSKQSAIALSSGVAELYAMLKGAGQTRGIMAMMIVFGFMVECVVCTDALAAIFMVHRQGLGKVRHIDVQYLWLQKDVLEGKLGVVKIGASANPVDLLTKYLRSEVASAHLEILGLYTATGRAASAPVLLAGTIRTPLGAAGIVLGRQIQPTTLTCGNRTDRPPPSPESIGSQD